TVDARRTMTIRMLATSAAPPQCGITHGEPAMPMPFPRRPLVLALALALPFGLVACKQPATDAPASAADGAATVSATDRQAESARLNAWFDKKYEEQLQFSPTQMTFLGRKDKYDQVDDVSEAGIRKLAAWQQASVQEMEAGFDYDKLDPEAQLSWDLWKKQADTAQAGLQFLEDGYPFNQMFGMQTQAPTLIINFHRSEERRVG